MPASVYAKEFGCTAFMLQMTSRCLSKHCVKFVCTFIVHLNPIPVVFQFFIRD